MELLQNMNMDTFVVVVPATLVGMYAIIALQKHLCFRDNPYTGLIVPVLCILAATILAVRPLVIAGTEGGMLWFCFKMWMVFNIPTVVLLFPYFKGRQNAKQMQAFAESQAASEEAPETAEADEAAVKNVN